MRNSLNYRDRFDAPGGSVAVVCIVVFVVAAATFGYFFWMNSNDTKTGPLSDTQSHAHSQQQGDDVNTQDHTKTAADEEADMQALRERANEAQQLYVESQLTLVEGSSRNVPRAVVLLKRIREDYSRFPIVRKADEDLAKITLELQRRFQALHISDAEKERLGNQFNTLFRMSYAKFSEQEFTDWLLRLEVAESK